MSVEITRKGNQDYAYFYPGRGGKIYLGNVTDKKNSQIKIDKVLESLDYVKGRYSHYSEIEDKLVSLLPPEKKDKYLSKRIDDLYKMAEKHISSLSDPELKRQYSGDRTKVRLELENEQVKSKFTYANLSTAAAAAGPTRKDIDKEVKKRLNKKKKKEQND